MAQQTRIVVINPRIAILSCTLSPKHRLNSKFVHFVNQHHKVVAEHLTQRLVDHRNLSLASQRISKLAFDHAKCGFDVRSLVVMSKELCRLELKVEVHLLPGSAAIPES